MDYGDLQCAIIGYLKKQTWTLFFIKDIKKVTKNKLNDI